MQYRVITLHAWSRETLAKRIAGELEGYDQHEIIGIQTGNELGLWLFFLVLYRCWAMILVKTLEPT
jgi:hypothetical protein